MRAKISLKLNPEEFMALSEMFIMALNDTHEFEELSKNLSENTIKISTDDFEKFITFLNFITKKYKYKEYKKFENKFYKIMSKFD